MRIIFIIIAILIGQIAAVHAQSPNVVKNSSEAVVAVTNLMTPGGLCVKMKPVHGIVSQRKFDTNGILPIGFVMEISSGERSYFNIDTVEINKLSNFQRNWVINGLQVLLRVGRTASVEYAACGAAGRVLMADTIR